VAETQSVSSWQGDRGVYLTPESFSLLPRSFYRLTCNRCYVLGRFLNELVMRTDNRPFLWWHCGWSYPGRLWHDPTVHAHAEHGCQELVVLRLQALAILA